MKTFGSFTGLFFVAVSAAASLVPVGPVPFTGTGIGAVNTVLTVGDRPIESGCVGRIGGADVRGPAACPPGFTGGDEKTGASQTQTRSIGELGLTTAGDLRIVLNVNESVGNEVSITNLVLTIYDPVTGAVLFTSGPFTPPTFTMAHVPGTTVGYVFELDEAQAAQAQLVFDPANRVGLAANLNGASAGDETFYVADVTAIGTPLFGTDLTVSKTAPATVIAGTNLTWGITVRNQGPEAAANVVVSDTLPAETRFASIVVPAGWTCVTPAVGAGGTITCSKASMAVAETANFSITARVCPEITCGTPVANTATASSSTIEAIPANNTSTATTTVQAQSDVSITKDASAAAVNPGGTVIYTLNVTNSGPSNSAGTTVDDTLPAGFTAINITTSMGSCSGAGTASVNCNLGTLGAANQCATAIPVTATITITAQASLAILPGVYTNTASVATANCLADPDPADNTDTVDVGVPAGGAGADLVITKIAPSTVIAGADLTYSLSVTNSGPDVATDVVVTDPLPPQTRLVSYTTPPGWSCVAPPVGSTGTVTCSKPSMVVAESSTFSVVVRTCAEIACGVVLSNTANVGSATLDPVPANNNATASVNVQAQSDLGITKAASSSNVNPGGTITYTLTVTNAGPSNSVGTTVVDTLPAGFVVAGVTTTLGTCSGDGTSTMNCSLGTLGASGQCATAFPLSATITLVAQVDAAAPAGTVMNTAQVSGGNCLSDPNPANNTATVPTTIGAVATIGVPTLSEIGIAIFAALLLLAGVYFVRV